jgi:hypothetical protein
VSVKLLARLPAAAKLHRQQIIEALKGDPRAAEKARVILRELFGGEIRLQPQPDGGLLALWNLQPGAFEGCRDVWSRGRACGVVFCGFRAAERGSGGPI